MKFVRATVINNKAWFCLADICKNLNLPQASDIVSRIKQGEKQKLHLSDLKKSSEMWFVDIEAYIFLERHNKVKLTLVEIEKQMKKLMDMKQTLLNSSFHEN